MYNSCEMGIKKQRRKKKRQTGIEECKKVKRKYMYTVVHKMVKLDIKLGPLCFLKRMFCAMIVYGIYQDCVLHSE